MRPMARHTKFTLLLVVIAVIGSGGSGPHAVEQTPQSAPPKHRDVLATYATLPLSLEANEGQTNRQVKFLSRGSGYHLYLTSNEAVLALRKSNGGGGGPSPCSLSGRRRILQSRRGGIAFEEQLLPRQRSGEVAHGCSELRESADTRPCIPVSIWILRQPAATRIRLRHRTRRGIPASSRWTSPERTGARSMATAIWC